MQIPNLKGIPKSAHILIFKDTKLAASLARKGYFHIICLSDDKVLPIPTKVKYYPYSQETHFPENMFDVIINDSLGEDVKDIGSFFLESYRIGVKNALLITPFSTTSKWLRVKDKPEGNKSIAKINIVCNSLGIKEGTCEYALTLKQRFEQEGTTVNLVRWLAQADKNFPTIFEYDPGIVKELPTDPNTIVEAHFTSYPNMFFEEIAHRAKLAIETKSIRFMTKEFIRLVKLATSHPEYVGNAIKRSDPRANEKLEKCRLLMRSPYLAEKSGMRKYTLMPLIAYPKLDYVKKRKANGLKLGSMGYALESKNFEKICDLAIRLKLPLMLLISINEVTPKMKRMQEQYVEEIKKKYSKYKNITLKIGYFAPEEILHELSDCTHLLYAQNEARGTSYSMRFGMQLGIPILATNVFQARDAQVYTVNSLDDITLNYLKKIKEPINLDDGFFYLKCAMGVK